MVLTFNPASTESQLSSVVDRGSYFVEKLKSSRPGQESSEAPPILPNREKFGSIFTEKILTCADLMVGVIKVIGFWS